MLEGLPKISVIVPTYNEVDNVEDLIEGLRSVLEGADFQIVVVDDNSPDGTYYAVKQIAERDPQVMPLLRPGKLGLASAVLHGFGASDGKLIVMMDSDLSHRPQDLPELLEAAKESDIVIGSRYVDGRLHIWNDALPETSQPGFHQHIPDDARAALSGHDVRVCRLPTGCTGLRGAQAGT